MSIEADDDLPFARDGLPFLAVINDNDGRGWEDNGVAARWRPQIGWDEPR